MSVDNDHYVDPWELGLQKSGWPLKEIGQGVISKRPGDQISFEQYPKRRKACRQFTPISDASNSPHPSRLSSPDNSHRSRVAGELKGNPEYCADQECSVTCGIEFSSRAQDLRRDAIMPPSVCRSKLQKRRHLITPPSSASCSLIGSIDADSRSERSTVPDTSPRRTGDIDVHDSENDGQLTLVAYTAEADELSNLICPYMACAMSYPQTLELTQEPQQLEVGSCTGLDSSNLSLLDTHKSSEAPTSITAYGRVYVPIDTQTNTMETSMFNNSTSTDVDVVSLPIKRDETTTVSTNLVSELAPKRDNGESEYLATDGRTLMTPLASESRNLGNRATNAESFIDMSTDRGGHGSIETWSLEIPDQFDDELVDSRSPSTTILMETAEEELGDRISREFPNDPELAENLLSKLRPYLWDILPLLYGEADEAVSDFSHDYGYNGQKRGPSGKTPASSSGASSSAKSTAGNSVTTPGTSVNLGEQGDDEAPQGPNKRRRNMRPRGGFDSDPGRRRLRCHFHAKNAITHNACVLLGYLNMKNLREHHSMKHTRIRCNKCFQEFQTKPSKNLHQKNCTLDKSPPTLDVIDCDKTDEIDLAFKQLRNWTLNTEEDLAMREWILKHKEDFAGSILSERDSCRELAKWYHMWRILFPSQAGMVPSPLQDASIAPSYQTVERLLQVFQSTVEAKIGIGQPPPSEARAQIQYYTEVNRTVLGMFFCEQETSVEPRLGLNPRLTSGSPNHSTASSLTIPATQRPNPRERQSPTHSTTPAPSGSVQQPEASLSQGLSPPDTINAGQTSSATLSGRSPHPAENIGANTSASVMMRPQPNHSNLDSNSVSPPQIQQAFTNGFNMPGQPMRNLENSILPLSTRAHPHGFGPQRQQQPRIMQLQQQQQQQQRSNQRTAQSFSMTVARAHPQFAAGTFPGNLYYAEGFNNEGNQDWDRGQLDHTDIFQQRCVSCSNTGLLAQNGEMVDCHCVIYSGLEPQQRLLL